VRACSPAVFHLARGHAMHNRGINAVTLHHYLQKTVKHGARAAQLARWTPELVNALASNSDHPDSDIYDRGVLAERCIRWAIRELGGSHGASLLLLLGLAPGASGPLEHRRRLAADVLHIQPGTFVRPHREGQLLWDLALELYKTQIPQEPPDHDHHT